MIAIKVQLLIFFTVLLVTLLTVTQHVKSEHATAYATDQIYTDALLLDKDERVDADLLASRTLLSKILFSDHSGCCYPTKAPHFKHKTNHLPRAPPYSLI